MAKTIHSGNITFIDLTDSKKVDVHISSNLPTIQIYDSNMPKYSPDWTSTPLVLTLTAYADSTDITDDLTEDSIKWYRQVGGGSYDEIQTGGVTLQISKNELIDTNIGWSTGVISYKCSIQYNNKSFENKITFARTDTGRNGAKGADGTSVNILGSYNTLEELQTAHPTGNAGDAYLINGNLYVWAEDDSQWENVGNIQGPAGADGKDAKSIVLSGDSQVFKVSKTNTITPSFITVTAQAFNTTVTNWTYSINGGQTFLSTVPTGVSRNGNTVTITGSNITANSLVIKASDGEVSDVFTIYKATDGVDGSQGSDGAPAPIAFLTNENVTFSANAQGQISGTTITSNVVAYYGDEKVTPTIGTITGVPTGMTITPSTITASNEIMLTITISNNATLGSAASNMGVISIPITSPVSTNLSLTWSKVNAGPTGATGAAGTAGTDAYTVILTNESHIFAGDVSNALTGSASTQVIAYKGSTSQSVTITSVNEKTASTVDTDTGIAGLKFKCSALSGTSPTITFTCTNAFTSASGSIPIVLSVGGVSFTKMFTYSIAFKGSPGATGQQGSAGVPASAYWLVSSASAVQKTSTGTIAVTPSTLTFTGKSQTGVGTPTDYACRWVIAYSTDGTNYIDLYTSTTNESSKSITVATTYKTIRARMYLADGTASLLDEQIIPIISDGAKGDTGVGVKSVTEYYLATSSSSGVTASTSGWTTTVQTITADKKYLWNYEIITYTDNTTSTTSPIIIGVFGNTGSTGATGKGIKSVTEYYLTTASSSGVTTSTTGWTTTMQTLTPTNKYLWNYELITYTDNTTSTINPVIIGVYGDKGDKGSQGDRGAGISSVTVTYGVSTSASTQPTSWQTTIPTVAEGSYLWTRTVTDYTDSAMADTVTYTYAKQGVKGDTGPSGSSVTVLSIQYQEGASATTTPTGTWSNTVVAVTEGKYLWTKTVFSDGKIAYGVAKQGVSGKDGVGISSITVDYGVSDSSTVKPTTWQQDMPSVAEGKYLWTRTITDYTDTSKTDTVAYIYAKQGAKGDTGSSGSSVTVSSIQYQAGTSSTTAPTSTWSNSVVAVAEGSYLWTKTTFSDGKIAYGVAKQGAKGSAGADAYTVILTNESHVFAGNVSSAIASSTTTQVMAYKGGASQSVTIVSVDGKTASTSSTATSIAGLSFACSALSGATPTITFTCTTSFVSPSGTIPIVVNVDGVTITKMFTYGIAFKGATGSQGTTGTAASLVDITPSAHYFKSTTGKDGTFTPEYIYLYPRFQTVTFSKWEYSVDGGTTWVAVSGANGISIGEYSSVKNTLRIARTSTLYTDTVTSISFRCVSSNASVYDTVSIAKIYDVVDLQIGGRNYILNSANLSVSGLGSAAGSSMEYKYIDVGQSYMNIANGTEVIISFDLEMTVNTANPVLTVYNSNRLGPKMIAYKSIQLTGAVGSTIKRRCSVVTQITDRESPTLTNNCIEFYSTYGTSNWFKITNLKLEVGNKATDWSPAPEDLNNVNFQIFAPNGYLLTNELQSLTLETFAYEGSIEITSGVTFQWSQLIDDVWTDINGATNTTLTVTRSDVLISKSYRCVMTYKSKEYMSTITVQDKTDTYKSIMCVSSNATGSECYWVVHSLVYSNTGEVDPLLGPISINAPTSPVNGDYWYYVDSANATVQLKKYNGTAWVNSTDKQSLTYLWNIVNDGSAKTPIGGASKVQVVSCHDFTTTATLMCDVSNEVDGVLTQSSLSITDASDPIVSQTEPTSAVDGQIWIKPNTNGSYNMFLWSKAAQSWIPSDMDTRNKVYTSKPSSYSKGDIWITESNTAHSKYLEGTLLQATKDGAAYNESDWSSTLKYDKDIDEIKGKLYDLSQYVTITSAGLKIGAVNSNDELSPFTSLFTSTELAFYQNSNKLLTLANNQLTAPRVVVEKDLEVEGSISLGNLQLTIETNGSFSFAVTK